MRPRTKLSTTIALVAVLAVGFGALGAASAQQSPNGSAAAEAAADPGAFDVQYSAPFICGWLPPVPPQDDQHAKPGDYATAIDIHNYTRTWIKGSKRVAIHYRMGTPAPPLVPWFRFRIAPLRVLQVDCTDIWAMAGLPPGTFVKGAVHIGLEQELPMAGIYTNQTHVDPLAGPDPGAGTSVDVEHILPFSRGAVG